MGKDRATSEPGGMECMSCGVIFIGHEADDECGDCFESRDAMKYPPCKECGAMTEDEATSRCMGRAAGDGCHGTDLWPG